MATIRHISAKRPIIHKGKDGCMNVAFYLKGTPVKGEPIRAADIELISGKSPAPGDIMICGSCNKNIKTIYANGWCE